MKSGYYVTTGSRGILGENDVSFPVGILPANKSHIPDDENAIWVGHSPNVFMERLVNMESLETPMYITNNVQGLDFAWPRLSGLDIAVSISGVFLIPNYRDLEAVDDTALFMLLQDNSQDMKDKYKFVQKHFCRHPVPDYYYLQLEVIANRTAKAQVVMCDSHDVTVPRCPPHHKDGTRYLQWDISQPCPFINTSQRFDKVTGGRNSVVCTEETELLRKVFQSSRPTTQEYMFPSQECTSSQRECSQCLEASQCRENRNNVNVSYLHDKYCCGISCYTKSHCQKYYSPACPPPKVECGLGDVNIFSLYPNFDSMTHQFACHLKYEPPQQLYSISYTIRAPSINLNITPQNFTVSSRSREDHEKRLSSFDFINAFHDTRYKVEDELILVGDHYDFIRNFDNLMKPCIVHKIKDPAELRRERKFTQDSYTKHVFIQFEKPFLYSSLSWHSDQCQKNISQIYPNQTIYEEDFIPMLARKNQHDSPINQQNSGFMYQLNQRDRAPYIKFYVERGKSVLQHLQGTVIKGKLIPSSLFGRVSWNHQIGKWMLDISGQQDACPTILSLKIFTQLMTGCAGHFDLLINCPRDFSVQLNFSTDLSDLPDIFVVQVNDSSTSHNLVLSSIYPPLHVDEMGQENPSPPSQELTSVGGAIKTYSTWAPICFIVLLTLIGLLVIFIIHTCINARVTGNLTPGRADTETPQQETPLQAQDGKIKNANSSSHFKHKRNVLIGCFIFLYVIYCVLFSFTLTFSVVYFPISMYWSNMTSLNQLGHVVGAQVDRLLHDISRFEQDERARLFSLYQRQRTACTVHLEQENRRLLDDYQQTTAKQVQAIFVENGTLHNLSNAIIQQNASVYMQQINEFVADCNKTVEAIVQRFQAKYYHFLSDTVLNDWLKVPRQIFLYQEGEDVNKQFLSSTWVKQFAVWLEIDKAEELLAVAENVFGRMSSIEAPRVSALNLTFPSVYPHVMSLEPAFDYHNHSYTYIVQLPMTNQEMQHFNLTLSPSGSEVLNFRKKRHVDEFGLSGNLMSNPDSQEFSHTSARSTDVSPGSTWVDDDLDHYARYLSDNFQSKKKIRSRKMKDTEDVGELLFEEKDTTREGIQNDERVENLILDQSSDSYKLDSLPADPDSSKSQDSKIPYILIGIFLTLDIFLWLYRFSWCSDQVYAARHGYADRIPTDEACKHFFEIQTAYHLPTFEHPHDESSGYYVDIKEQLNPEKDSPDITFLQDLPKHKDNKDDILQKIWNEKMNKSKEMGCLAQCCLVRWCYSAKKILQRLFLSKLAWQGSITFTAILFICLFIYCVEFWLTPETFRTLVGGHSAAADVMWHLESSSHYLQTLAQQLTLELERVKDMCDHEVNTLTDIFFATVNMQTSMFTTTLQRLCYEARKDNCDKLTVYQSTGGRIVGCNFLPLQAQTYHDVSLSSLDAAIMEKVAPLLELVQWMLVLSTSVVVTILCLRLLCQAVTSTVRNYLLLAGHLPRVRVYQSEEQHLAATQVNTTMQRSQSWVESCESGVYLGETEDTNKEESR
ncbi:uncharacterized protein LOC131933641 [Physella acuta]|uniref:uncharacterized protein LOC131933641 n=1 Tax=Physella acuta TaxID=109671 RepID=UPI0027DC6A23|nr:uncharacterized protein LOC131933641 [Physella acuta]